MMDETENKIHGKNDAELPLPKEAVSARRSKKSKDGDQPAADLIRKKIAAAYGEEPSAAHEVFDLEAISDLAKPSPHQKFAAKLTSSGKSFVEIQSAWHEYYQGLSDEQKHEVWAEFYSAHKLASRHLVHQKEPSKGTRPKKIIAASEHTTQPSRGRKVVHELHSYARTKTNRHKTRQPSSPLRSLFFGLGVGSLVLVVFMFSFFNERFIAPFIQPSRNITNTPIITDGGSIGQEPEILIPKINVEIPVVYGVDTISESSVQKALEGGVVHYADTAKPGENGNVVIVGHSSNNIFNQGKYKFAFVLLSRLQAGDTFYLQRDGKRYTYQVYEKTVVAPTEVSVLAAGDKTATATLITCDPPGTSAKRLVVIGEQISPDPASNIARTSDNSLAVKSAVIPGNAPSLWSRFVNWFLN